MDRFENHVNKTIDGRYQIKNVVGVGGMAYVLRADDLLMNRTVAIKILNDEFNTDEMAIKRFINESKAVSMLSHHNIVSVFDVTIKDDFKYIVMEYIDGITLKDYIDKKGALEWKEAVHYTLQILEGLSHAHSKGVIHRDIKPQNIMLMKDGSIKVADFGIAKIPNNESITVTDKAIGTVNYISPEQASGSAVDAQSDLYSVGVMLYEMVTGKLPYISESPVAVATMHVSSIPRPPREINPAIPEGLEQIILKAMKKEPGARFSSANAMRKAIIFLVENPAVVFSERGGPKGSYGESLASFEGKKGQEKSGRIKINRSMLPIISGVTFSFFIVGIVFTFLFVGQIMNRNGNDYTSGKSKNENFVITFFSKFLSGNEGDGTEIVIPNLVGKEYNDLLTGELSKKKYRITSVKYINDPDARKNTILSQEPEANAVRKLSPTAKSYDIRVTVNKGANDVEIPNYELVSYSAARTDLINLGFERENIIRQEEFNDTIVDGYVVRTEPVSGEVASLTKNTKITIFVSKGRKIETTLVPELANLTVEQAKKAILESNLSIGTNIYVTSDLPAGTVIKGSKPTNTTVPQKITKIDLYVSLGNSAKPTTTEPTKTPPTTTGNGTTAQTPSTKPEQKPEGKTEGKADGTGDYTGFTIDANGNFVFNDPSAQTSEGGASASTGGTASGAAGSKSATGDKPINWPATTQAPPATSQSSGTTKPATR